MTRPRKPSTIERRRLLTQIRKDCNKVIKWIQHNNPEGLKFYLESIGLINLVNGKKI